MVRPQDLLLYAGSDDDCGFNEEADQTQDPVPEFQLQYEQPVLLAPAVAGVADRFDQQEVHPWPHHQSWVPSRFEDYIVTLGSNVVTVTRNVSTYQNEAGVWLLALPV